MQQEQTDKNLFFGLEVRAPWAKDVPMGRILSETARHITLAFLGKVDKEKILEEIKLCPKPSSNLGASGICDELLLLPEKNPRVVSYHVSWQSGKEPLLTFREKLVSWLAKLDYKMDERPFLSHVTVARAPFDEKAWRKQFCPLPLIATNIHLYQTTQSLTYHPLWTYPLTPPFQEVPHTGDVAYLIRGRDLTEIFCHAQLAMSFEFEGFLHYFTPTFEGDTLDQLVMTLNAKGALFDKEVGAPFKGVSFHGELKQETEENLVWEMIIDV